MSARAFWASSLASSAACRLSDLGLGLRRLVQPLLLGLRVGERRRPEHLADEERDHEPDHQQRQRDGGGDHGAALPEHASVGHDQVDRDVALVGRAAVDDLEVVGEADERRSRPRGHPLLERVVVVAAAAAHPPPVGVEGQPRNDHDVERPRAEIHERVVVGLRDAKASRRQRRSELDGVKRQEPDLRPSPAPGGARWSRRGPDSPASAAAGSSSPRTATYPATVLPATSPCLEQREQPGARRLGARPALVRRTGFATLPHLATERALCFEKCLSYAGEPSQGDGSRQTRSHLRGVPTTASASPRARARRSSARKERLPRGQTEDPRIQRSVILALRAPASQAGTDSFHESFSAVRPTAAAS